MTSIVFVADPLSPDYSRVEMVSERTSATDTGARRKGPPLAPNLGEDAYARPIAKRWCLRRQVRGSEGEDGDGNASCMPWSLQSREDTESTRPGRVGGFLHLEALGPHLASRDFGCA